MLLIIGIGLVETVIEKVVIFLHVLSNVAVIDCIQLIEVELHVGGYLCHLLLSGFNGCLELGHG